MDDIDIAGTRQAQRSSRSLAGQQVQANLLIRRGSDGSGRQLYRQVVERPSLKTSEPVGTICFPGGDDHCGLVHAGDVTFFGSIVTETIQCSESLTAYYNIRQRAAGKALWDRREPVWPAVPPWSTLLSELKHAPAACWQGHS